MKNIKPIRDREKYSKEVFDVVNYTLYAFLFKPLLDLLDVTDRQLKKELKRENVRPIETLTVAFEKGRLFYHDGYVHGKFNAILSEAIRRLLKGEFNKTRKAYRVESGNIPITIRTAIAKRAMTESEKLMKIQKTLDNLAAENLPEISVDQLSDNIVSDLEVQFKRVTPRELEVSMDMQPGSRKTIKEEYNKNLNLSVKGWTSEAVERMRDKVTKSVAQGFRADKLAKELVEEYHVTYNRAKFIASQETSLLVSKYRQARYSDAGVSKYRWSTSHDRRVRHDHRDLNNRVFSWDDPPIVDKATGRKAHPGEDFRCRCVALPVL